MSKTRLALAATTVCALLLGAAAPAGAQEEPESLGFAVDKTQAQPGALVLGKADAADVAEHCTTTVEGFQERFQELGPVLGSGSDIAKMFFPPDGQLFPPAFENHDQTAYAFLILIFIGLINNVGGATEDALPEFFVMTFADIATQEPVGERGNFDLNTGEGSVVVPDIAPGLWAVAAACVGPSLDPDVLEAAIRAGGAFLEEIGAPINAGPELDEFIRDFLDDEDATLFDDFLPAIAPTLLEPMMVPDAFGAVLFCILDEQGNCPADEPPAPPPGEPIEPKPDGEAGPAQAVVAAPAFTG